MRTDGIARRGFLKAAGAGLAGGALIGLHESAIAESAPKSKPVYDVRAFGAKGDGTSLDTAAIQRAIDAAAASGGGIVRFPAGNYLSYSIHLKSHVGLYLAHGATVVSG